MLSCAALGRTGLARTELAKNPQTHIGIRGLKCFTFYKEDLIERPDLVFELLVFDPAAADLVGLGRDDGREVAHVAQPVLHPLSVV